MSGEVARPGRAQQSPEGHITAPVYFYLTQPTDVSNCGTETIILDTKIEDADDLGQEGTVTIQYVTQGGGEEDQAVRNLLEFHNQQPAFAFTGSGGPSNSLSQNLSPYSVQDVKPMIGSPFGVGEPVSSNNVAATSFINRSRNPPLRCYGKKRVGKDPLECNTEDPNSPPTNSLNSVTSASSSYSKTDYLKKALPEPSLPLLKKRRVITDSQTVISRQEFKRQLKDTSDIVTSRSEMEYAPASKRAMHYLEYGGVGKYFANPGRKSHSVPLAKLFFSRLIVTTERHSANSSKHIPPLDSDLKTPDLPEATKLKTVVLPAQFNDAVAKRTANSFDSLCKGMMKSAMSAKGLRNRRNQHTKLSQRLVTGRPPESASKPKESRILIVNTLPPQDIDVGVTIKEERDSTREPDPPDTHSVMYTLEDDIVMKSEEPKRQFDEICEDESLPCISMLPEPSSASHAPSNFDMLIAAAEQHNHLSSTVQLEILKPKSDILYTPPTDDESLIVFNDGGDRFRMTASTRGDLSLWSENECEANIFA